MSCKIRVSYTEDRELVRILALIGPAVKSCRKSKNKEGSYRKAYIEIKPEQKKLE